MENAFENFPIPGNIVNTPKWDDRVFLKSKPWNRCGGVLNVSKNCRSFGKLFLNVIWTDVSQDQAVCLDLNKTTHWYLFIVGYLKFAWFLSHILDLKKFVTLFVFPPKQQQISSLSTENHVAWGSNCHVGDFDASMTGRYE